MGVTAKRSAGRDADETLLCHGRHANAGTRPHRAEDEGPARDRDGAVARIEHPAVEARRRVQPDGVIEARALPRAPHEPVRARGGAEESAIAPEDEHGRVEERVLRKRPPEPHPEGAARGAAPRRDRCVGIALADLDRTVGPARARVLQDRDAQILPVGEAVGRRRPRRCVLMREPLPRVAEARGEGDDETTRLPSLDATERELPSVAHALDRPVDLDAVAPGPYELRVDRVRHGAGHRPPGRDHTLGEKHPAEDAPLAAPGNATEAVGAARREVESANERVDEPLAAGLHADSGTPREWVTQLFALPADPSAGGEGCRPRAIRPTVAPCPTPSSNVTAT